MKIGPLFKWFGSKWQSAKRYPKPIDGIPLFEPFAGGAGYSLNFVDHDVRIFESNILLTDLWKWLITKATQDLIRAIPVDYPEGFDIRTSGLDYGQQLLIKHWQRTNNYGNCWTISPWGNKPGQWTENTRARVSEQYQAVRHWKFEPCLYRDVGTYFVDPPYQFNYQYGCKNFNYLELSRDLLKVPYGSLAIVCEAACPKTGTIPDWLPFIENHKSVTSRRKVTQSHHSKELIYVRDHQQ